MHRLILLTTALSLIALDRCVACLWDEETVRMEDQPLPGPLDLISGYFVRHSTAYYKWRIDDRTVKPIEQRTPLDYDDVAVAYDKLGQHDKAIETIQAKLDRWPEERLYESEANLGTFLIHAGHFEEGLRHINRAIEINPKAHFGREIYQKLLVEYVMESGGRDKELPLNDDISGGSRGFVDFVLAKQKPTEDVIPAEIQSAVTGVRGMMRFGHHDSPILLEALGDLLLAQNDSSKAKALAAHAYLKASYEVDNPASTAAYREKAERAMETRPELDLAEIEEFLRLEIEDGDGLLGQITADEQKWISAGIEDVGSMLVSKYYHNDEENSQTDSTVQYNSNPSLAPAILIALAIVVVAGAWVISVMTRLRS